MAISMRQNRLQVGDIVLLLSMWVMFNRNSKSDYITITEAGQNVIFLQYPVDLPVSYVLVFT